jgi:two-component system sensor histidine kinase BaeS
MPFGLKHSVRARLTFAILVAILLSSLLGAGAFFYFAHLEARALQNHPVAAHLLDMARHHAATVLWVPVRIGGGAFVLRMVLAVGVALVLGALFSRAFTRPLAALARGARAFHDGDLRHRIPLTGDDEFAQVSTTMNEMADRVAGQLATLEDDARRRQQLLADVAHELRSPVAALAAMTDALRDGVADDPARRVRALEAMHDAAARLQRLVGDLMDLTRLDLRELPLHRTAVDLPALAAERLAAHADAAANAGITLTSAPTTPVTVDADPVRLAQVLDNLLENAISYAGAGATIAITLTEPATLTVHDTGRGIAAAHLPYIFDPFYRADAARTPGDSHSGLGLRIARALVEAHGGTLTLASEEGNGVTVTITLPQYTPTPSSLSPSA